LPSARLLEVVLIQRFVLFLGFPTYALSVVLFSLLLFTGLSALLSASRADARTTLTTALALGSVLIVARPSACSRCCGR
jgi:hypothetical protein